MNGKTKLIELLSNDGQVVLSFSIREKEVDLNSKPANKKMTDKDTKSQGNNNQTENSLMTDAQKRYLFRILSDQGYEGDKAHQRLLELFETGNLKEVTKFEASKLIEHLLEEVKTNGGASNGSSF